VREHKEEFKRGSNKERKEIAKRILDLISARTPPGRFLGKDHVTVLDEKAAIKRIRQTFVDMLNKSKKQKNVSGKTNSTTASTMASATEDANTSANIPAAATHGTTAQLSATETTSDGGASLDENKKKNKTTTTTSNTPPTRIDGDDDENMDDDNDNNDDFDPGPDSSGSNDEEDTAPGRGVEECKEEYTSDSDDDENVDDDRPPPPPRSTPRPKSGRNNGGNGGVSILQQPKYPESSEGRNRQYTREEYNRPCVSFAPDESKPCSERTVKFKNAAEIWWSEEEKKRSVDESKSEYVSGNKLKLKSFNSDTGLLDICDHDDDDSAKLTATEPGTLGTTEHRSTTSPRGAGSSCAALTRTPRSDTPNPPPPPGTENKWICDYCNIASFSNYEEACAHEVMCQRSFLNTGGPAGPSAGLLTMGSRSYSMGASMDQDDSTEGGGGIVGGNNNNAEQMAAVANDSTEGGGGVVGGNNNNAEHTAAVANDSTEGGGGVVGGNNNNAEHTEEESTPVLKDSIPTSIVVIPLRDQIEEAGQSNEIAVQENVGDPPPAVQDNEEDVEEEEEGDFYDAQES